VESSTRYTLRMRPGFPAAREWYRDLGEEPLPLYSPQLVHVEGAEREGASTSWGYQVDAVALGKERCHAIARVIEAKHRLPPFTFEEGIGGRGFFVVPWRLGLVVTDHELGAECVYPFGPWTREQAEQGQAT
jgi:hypothetical protein